jgi:hypothetical protein
LVFQQLVVDKKKKRNWGTWDVLVFLKNFSKENQRTRKQWRVSGRKETASKRPERNGDEAAGKKRRNRGQVALSNATCGAAEFTV